MDLKIYHNPRCSKSREALALLTSRGIAPEIVEYLKVPPAPEELRTLLEALGMSARELLRRGEPAYKTLGLDVKTLSEDALILAMSQNPSLIERPIVLAGSRAVVGRPPERVLDLLS